MAKVQGSRRVTREDLERYYELDEQRLEHQRKADDVARLMKELHKKFLAFVVANGGAEKSTTCCGYRLYLVVKRKSVAWKDNFLRMCGVAGRNPVKEAEALVLAAPTTEELHIDPPETSEA